MCLQISPVWRGQPRFFTSANHFRYLDTQAVCRNSFIGQAVAYKLEYLHEHLRFIYP